jgi:hypothetical protein
VTEHCKYLLRVIGVLVFRTASRHLGRKDGSFGIRCLFGGDIPHVLNPLIYVMKVDVLHASVYIFPNVRVIVIEPE